MPGFAISFIKLQPMHRHIDTSGELTVFEQPIEILIDQGQLSPGRGGKPKKA
jgi:hypothetical protein